MGEQVQFKEIHYGDSHFRPDIHGVLVQGKRGRILSVLYTAAGEEPHPTVLLLHGIPGCERNLDLAQSLRRAGFHVMTFHYSGSWGSDGQYSLQHNLEDANTVLDFILEDHTYAFNQNQIFAVGHSLGGFVCGQLTAHRPEIRGGVLLMPCDIGRLPQIAKEDPTDYQRIREVLDESAKWLAGTSGEALLKEILDNSEAFRLENLAEALSKKPIFCVGGTLDSYTPPTLHCEPIIQAIQRKNGAFLRTINYQTDHFFADYRLTVADAVEKFLSGLIVQ